MAHPHIIVADNPDTTDRETISAALTQFNEKIAGPSHFEKLAIMIQDPATGEKVGGLWGRTIYGWLIIELLVVPEKFRGQNLGSQILSHAEEIAQQRGCKGAWVDTYDFQAPGFYQKHGFETFGTIEGHPPGSRRVFLKKSLV